MKYLESGRPSWEVKGSKRRTAFSISVGLLPCVAGLVWPQSAVIEDHSTLELGGASRMENGMQGVEVVVQYGADAITFAIGVTVSELNPAHRSQILATEQTY
jgi:hypothetical protein